ncbi:hypothetical protein CWE12_00735 [Aliidiomarina sedimenti]|uniref:Abortive phage infection protein C-terminal domain-containing protein n=1 Tax=Aliidiomarina sedimenti TaxID=1933879 RepID=A0ABY0C1P3_9GAMM|nr:AIPR family protein [Aliidiomarina sedimenti]RUO31558.1 hypothetical protein CWE12_00735 [Aliidiomarina sedimenti]
MSRLSLNKAVAPASNKTKVQFHSLRNISSPDDLSNDRKVLTGHMKASEILQISTNDNVRDYLLAVDGKKKVPTAVHRAITATLENSPEKFSVLNGGITIVAEAYDVDEKVRELTLINASIINGAQTQGILRDYINTLEDPKDFPDIHITFELIICTDEPLIAEISIARNFQNDVKMLSISGKLGSFDDLAKSIEKHFDGLKLRLSETDSPDDTLDTEKLLQVITALTPEEIWTKLGRGDLANKNYAYNQKTKCLKQFTEMAKSVKDGTANADTKDAYEFFVEIAPSAWELYQKWKTHEGFIGTGIRSIHRDGKKILDVPDGIVFPALAALAEFVTKSEDDNWLLTIPDIFDDRDLISAIKSTYQNVADHKPYVMGRSKAAYSSLIQVTAIYKRLLNK